MSVKAKVVDQNEISNIQELVPGLYKNKDSSGIYLWVVYNRADLYNNKLPQDYGKYNYIWLYTSQTSQQQFSSVQFDVCSPQQIVETLHNVKLIRTNDSIILKINNDENLSNNH